MRRAVLLALIGCGGQGNNVTPDAAPADAAIDAPMAPVFRNPVDLPDDQLALEALKLLGGNVEGAAAESCNSCHGITRQNLRYWRALSDTAMASCFTDLSLGSAQSAQATIDCMRSMPAVPTSDYATKHLGIYAIATHLPWFEFAFWRVYGGDATSRLGELTTTAGMPRGLTPFTQAQFDIVAEWFVRGLPELEATLPQDPPPSTCTDAISAEVATHVTAMKTTGWRAVNAGNMMAMHGCGAATDPRQCLASVPLGVAQPYGTGWDLPGRGQLRVLADVDYASSYWTRSSPDGRFIAHGVQNVQGSYVLDLQRDTLRLPINATYDPNWFPDNSGFVFQGGPRNVCGQSVLTSNPASVTMQEAACSSITSIGLYEHVGRAVRVAAAGLGGDTVRGRRRDGAVRAARDLAGRGPQRSPARVRAPQGQRDARRHDLHDHRAGGRALLRVGRQARVLVRRALDHVPSLRDGGRRGRARVHGADRPGVPALPDAGRGEPLLDGAGDRRGGADHEHAAGPVRAVPALPLGRVDLRGGPGRQRRARVHGRERRRPARRVIRCPVGGSGCASFSNSTVVHPLSAHLFW